MEVPDFACTRRGRLRMNQRWIARIRNGIRIERGRIVEIGRFIHANPELGYEEFGASKRIAGYLERLGFEVEMPYAGLKTAFRAVLKGKGRGHKVAVLAEYDALKGLGHGCGHNLISVAAMAAAAGMAACRGRFAGQFEVIGTPGEEGKAGKEDMIRAGAFRHLDACFMTHPSMGNKICIGCTANKMFNVRFKGRSVHAATPQEGINALDAAVLFYNSINSLRQHLGEDARVHAIITNGGQAVNVIPELAEVAVCVRSMDEGYLHGLERRVMNAARSAGRAVGASVSIARRGHWYRSFCPNTALDTLLIESYGNAGIALKRGTGKEGRGSLDMANVSKVVPSSHPYFCIVPKNAGKVALHTLEFLQLANARASYEQAIRAGIGMALAVCRLLSEQNLVKQIKKEFMAGGSKPAKSEG
ncbi:MAG: hypothetical protein C0404_09375 [Verrucomicrobia bacterium]|nr:hypothetical protein [Verrucomicrobiota bacterium]